MATFGALEFSFGAWTRQTEIGIRVLKPGGESVLVNGAVFKTVSETVRTGSGRFDSYTPPPGPLPIAKCRLPIGLLWLSNDYFRHSPVEGFPLKLASAIRQSNRHLAIGNWK
jgi:hypothetical protein